MTTKKVTKKVGPKMFPQALKASFEKVEDKFYTKELASKPATILYKKLPDNMILITGFENFLTADELMDKYGRVIAKAYNDYPYHMTASLSAVFMEGLDRVSFIAAGQLFHKNDFTQIRNHINRCGSLLHDIIAAVNGGQEKRITI